ncbi:MAG: hypothetical protein IJ529_01015 [Alphaproteobacteria bacterium]|nr:hypothetical protein [Alphaproteobacteria bacterium]MBQ9234873.1 hypothetical protein [Alphaproteobacteria bacterium]
MNKFWTFTIGVLFGMIVIPFIIGFFNGFSNTTDGYNNPYGIKGLKMLEKKGDCITSNNLEIFQNLANGIALAHPVNNYDTLVLLIDESGKLFYDGEKVKNPAKKCAKQIGTYQYETKAETMKTVPAVIIE